MPGWIFWVAVAVPLVWGIAIYNSLVRLRQHCREAWSGIETELKRRHDLVPNLVEVVRGHAGHEREVLELVVVARGRAIAQHASPSAVAQDENAFVGELRRLFALSEGYPELVSSQSFLRLQAEVANTEDRIKAARRFYNANVRDLNTRVQSFPSNLVASLFAFTAEEFLELTDGAVRQPPDLYLTEPA